MNIIFLYFKLSSKANFKSRLHDSTWVADDVSDNIRNCKQYLEFAYQHHLKYC